MSPPGGTARPSCSLATRCAPSLGRTLTASPRLTRLLLAAASPTGRPSTFGPSAACSPKCPPACPSSPATPTSTSSSSSCAAAAASQSGSAQSSTATHSMLMSRCGQHTCWRSAVIGHHRHSALTQPSPCPCPRWQLPEVVESEPLHRRFRSVDPLALDFLQACLGHGCDERAWAACLGCRRRAGDKP